MGILAAIDFSTDDPLGVLDRNPARRALDINDHVESYDDHRENRKNLEKAQFAGAVEA